MNVKLLRKVQKHILAEPRRFEMQTFGELLSEKTLQDMGASAPPCGTQACIGGTACWIAHPRVFIRVLKYSEGGMADRAQKLLKLTSGEASRLFYFSDMVDADTTDNYWYWPEKFETAYIKAETPLAKAKIAAKRIDHFIATKGAE